MAGPGDPALDSETDPQGREPDVDAALTPTPRPIKPTASAQILDRYVVLDDLATGPRGAVMAAYDIDLERKVAIKLLRPEALSPDDPERARETLLQRAQAATSLAHPNVIAIHQVGSTTGGIFIVMELAAATLAQRLRERVGWRELLDLFLQAGRGLAAGHAAGLAHGDFTAANVLVGKDGRARLSDFGLPGVDGTSALSDAADAAGDQVAFAGAVEEALFPSGDGARARAPARLRRILRRAKHADPTRRYPSVAALVDALDRSARSRRRRLAALAAAGLAIAAAAVLLAGRGPARPLCTGGPERLAGVWDDAVREAGRQAFLATGRPHADDTWTRVAAVLDDQTQQRVAAQHAACEATRIRHAQEEEVLARRTECLDRLLSGTRALTGLFATTDAKLVGRSIDAVYNLPDVRECDAVSVAATPILLPRDPAAAARIAGIRSRVAQASAFGSAGKYQEALALAQQAAQDAHDAGNPAVEAETLDRVGHLEAVLGDIPSAEAHLFTAATLAEATRFDRLSASAWTNLVMVVGQLGARPAEALQWAELAQAALIRMGDPTVQRARLTQYLASVSGMQGRYADAERYARLGLVFSAMQGADRPQTGLAHQALGISLRDLGRFEEATAELERGLAILEKVFGKAHPQVARALSNLGATYLQTRNPEKAVAVLLRADEIQEAVFGPTHVELGINLSNLGEAYSMLRDYDTALHYHERALAILERALGPDHPQLLGSLHGIATVSKLKGDYARAIESDRRAIALVERALGANHPHALRLHAEICGALFSAHRLRDAIAECELAIRLGDKIGDPGGFLPAAWMTTGEAWLALKQPQRAIPPLERAVALLAEPTAFVENFAYARLRLAEALWETGGDRTRALELAHQARAACVAESRAYPEALTTVDAWLAGHRGHAH